MARRLEEIFYKDLKYSGKVTCEEWNSHGLKERFFELSVFPIKDLL